MDQLQKYLTESASHHHHICPRQVLGVRMGLFAGQLLDLPVPQTDKRLLAIAETDGCFVSGIGVATGCWVSRRTLRIEDYGKVAATFLHVQTKQAFRIAPRIDVRQRAYQYASHQKRRYYAQLVGYQTMPEDELFTVHKVSLLMPVENLIGRAGVRVNCENCGEEIINRREVFQDGQLLCKSCAGESNYYLVEPSMSVDTRSPMSPVSMAARSYRPASFAGTSSCEINFDIMTTRVRGQRQSVDRLPGLRSGTCHSVVATGAMQHRKKGVRTCRIDEL